MICIGERIKAELERQERGVSWLAGKLGCSRKMVYRLFEKNSIDTLLLMRISKVLHRDFFREFSGELEDV
ncbi:MAG: XRE family transcriptional regulator [Bacteroidaceae bacterium]|nr:XRE family transcriptional regulator [Bacteroidaceae bacterium]MDE5740474.1 XRE family transcriptional regulator [Bacteroidaceae bacterium]MDE5999267.1 XRE family transcriptional regulator [Bacteroidaceae bacterium]MDE6721072.1 XRE family transcriptional regulator [Bacteroidaceae bacterium]MDE7117720.1 XRE family transcriptional regulator [Bacteroidaceae bacterium]